MNFSSVVIWITSQLMLEQEVVGDRFERLACLIVAEDNALAQIRIQRGLACGKIQKLGDSIRQRVILDDQRHPVETVHADSNLSGFARDLTTRVNQIEAVQVWLGNVVLVALNLWTDDLALDADPLGFTDHGLKNLAQVILLGNSPECRAIVGHQPAVTGTDTKVILIRQEGNRILDTPEEERAGLTINLLTANPLGILILKDMWDVLDTGFIGLGHEIRETIALTLSGSPDELGNRTCDAMSEHELAKWRLGLLGILLDFVGILVILGDAEDIGYIVADLIIALRKKGQREANALRQNTSHLHGLDSEVLLSQELKLRLLRENRIDFNIDALVSGLVLILLNDDRPAEDFGKNNAILAFDGMNVTNLLN